MSVMTIGYGLTSVLSRLVIDHVREKARLHDPMLGLLRHGPLPVAGAVACGGSRGIGGCRRDEAGASSTRGLAPTSRELAVGR